MAASTPTSLKARFETGDIPNQSDYEDLIDSFVNFEVTAAVQVMKGSLTVQGELVVGQFSAANVTAQNFVGETGTFGSITTSALNVTSVLDAATVSAGSATFTTVATDSIDATLVSAKNRITQPVDSSVAGMGTTQASGKSLSSHINVLESVGSATDNAFILPGGYGGWTQTVINNTSVTAQIFPPVGASATIDGLSANNAQTLNPSGIMTIYHVTSARFFTQRGV